MFAALAIMFQTNSWNIEATESEGRREGLRLNKQQVDRLFNVVFEQHWLTQSERQKNEQEGKVDR